MGMKWFDLAFMYELGPMLNFVNHISRQLQEYFFLQRFLSISDFFISTSIGWADRYNASTFLDDLNDKKGEHPEYKERLLALKHLGLYKFFDDTKV